MKQERVTFRFFFNTLFVLDNRKIKVFVPRSSLSACERLNHFEILIPSVSVYNYDLCFNLIGHPINVNGLNLKNVDYLNLLFIRDFSFSL